MKIVVMCSSAPNQIALVNKIIREVGDLKLIFYSAGYKEQRKRPSLREISRKTLMRILGYPIIRAWNDMQKHFRKQNEGLLVSPDFEVSDINDPQVIQFILKCEPDLVVVSGTNLLKKSLIKAIKRSGKVMNLHTGISPFIKGGPNCTNWCLSLGEFGLIGNTIMWLDAGIDSGNIIATERTHLTGEETLNEVHLKVMCHAHDLYLRSIVRFAAGKTLPNVPQRSLGNGRTFYTRNWTVFQMVKALFKYRYHYHRQLSVQQQPIKLVSLEQ